MKKINRDILRCAVWLGAGITCIMLLDAVLRDMDKAAKVAKLDKEIREYVVLD